MQQQNRDKQVLEPEVLPPGSAGPGRRSSDAGRQHPPARMALFLVGLFIDALDLLTFGPMGTRFGWFIGFATAFLALTYLKLPMRQRLTWSLMAGIYCAIPATERIPIASVLAALYRR